MDHEEQAYRARHGEKGALGQKGAASAWFVLGRFSPDAVLHPTATLTQYVRAADAATLVNATADEFGITLARDERTTLINAAPAMTVTDYCAWWKVRANAARAESDRTE